MSLRRLVVAGASGLLIVGFGFGLKATQEMPRSAAQAVYSSPNQGPQGTAGSSVFGSPNARSLSLATAYQATDPTRAAMVTVNLTSSASITLTSGTTNTATVVIGATSGVATGTGAIICNYGNSNTGTLSIGINLSTVSAQPCSFSLPIGWFFAIRQTAGTVTITSAFDQSVG